MIQIQAVDKWFGDFHALKGINLDIGRGEKIVVCGPSGSGKSTLIRCINGLEEISAGRILIDGEELSQKPAMLRRARTKVGMVFQQFNLFPHLTVLNNLTLAPMKVLGMKRSDAESRALELLARVMIENQSDKFPGQLSGGQQQRVAIARALCMNPEALLFDEPTSALDPEMIKEVLDVMQDLTKIGVTMVCVTHEMKFAEHFADRVVFMEDGLIIEASPTPAFFDRPKSERAQAFLDKIL